TAQKLTNLSAGPHTVTIQYRSIDSVELDTYIRNAVIVAVKTDDLEVFEAAADGQVPLATSPTDIVTLNWTPSTAGDYLLLYCAEITGGWDKTVSLEARHEGVLLDAGTEETPHVGHFLTWRSASVVSCDTSEQTAKISAWSTSTVSQIRRARVLALRLSGGALGTYVSAADATESSTSSTTYQQKLSHTWDAGTQGDWLILADARVMTDSGGTGVETRLELDDSTEIAQQGRQPRIPGHWVDFSVVALESLASTTTLDIDYRSDDGLAAARISYASLIALALSAPAAAPVDITTTTLSDGQVGVAYSQTLAATGGVPPYSWAVTVGSLPAGLSLNSGTGEISGTPTTPETAPFTVEVTDSDAPASTDQQALSITIDPAALAITTSSLPDGQVGVAYSETLAATGGVTPYSWAVTVGSLPAGLSLNSSTGEISGTPTAYETANFTVEVTDSDAPPATDQQALSITVDPAVLVITTASLADGQVGVAYSETLAATGGVTPYSWAVTVGSLPAGLSLDSGTGEISGTPTTAETANFTVEVTDSDAPASTDTQALSITVDPAVLVITTASLADGQVGVAYSEALAATGGVTPYSWAVTVGSLPAGLSLNSSTGEISGTPTTAETANFTVEVTDSQGTPDTDTQALSITIDPAALVITTASLADGQEGVAYSETLAATGGVTPYSWAVTVGSLPAGLSLDSGTGEISGTPTTAETANFTVEVTDSDAPASTDTQALSITINAAAGGVTYEYASSASIESTNSDVWQDKVVLNFTSADADDWIILGSAEHYGDYFGGHHEVRLQIDGGTEGYVTLNPTTNYIWLPFTAQKLTNLSAGPHTVTIQYR
ncbi:MAG: Ig domain-containing protein, partial [Planctomycetota bacterium]